MSLCQSIDTLSMAFLDDELAAEERRELELHLLDCPPCRAHVDTERTELSSLRAKLVAPPAPDLFKARIAQLLDTEDRIAVKAERKRWSQFLLPASALVAAAAALAVFVAVKPSTNEAGAVAQEVARQNKHPMPLEVQGPSTGPWLREHFATAAALPQFGAPNIRLVGARLTAINGHDAAMIRYQIAQNGDQYGVLGVMIKDLAREELGTGEEIVVGQRVLHVVDVDGIPAITYVGPNHVGYAFFSRDIAPQELLELVVTSDLISRAQAGQ
jgi:anti-sigma factor RsiW